MKKKHFVSLAVLLHHLCKILDERQRSAVVAAVAGWCGMQADGFDGDRFREVVETGRGNY